VLRPELDDPFTVEWSERQQQSIPSVGVEDFSCPPGDEHAMRVSLSYNLLDWERPLTLKGGIKQGQPRQDRRRCARGKLILLRLKLHSTGPQRFEPTIQPPRATLEYFQSARGMAHVTNLYLAFQ
jgi:hypothetical protein